MRCVESLQAILERQLIRELVVATARARSDEERQRRLDALSDLVQHVDPTLNPQLLDTWTRAYLERNGLALEPQNANLP